MSNNSRKLNVLVDQFAGFNITFDEMSDIPWYDINNLITMLAETKTRVVVKKLPARLPGFNLAIILTDLVYLHEGRAGVLSFSSLIDKYEGTWVARAIIDAIAYLDDESVAY